MRIQCAKCHNHPFEKWTQDDYYGTAAAFNRVGRKETGLPDDELIFVKAGGEVTQPRTGKTMKVRLLLQGDVDVAAGADRRVVFADWLTSGSNPFFARSLANRIWGHVVGKGIVDPVDDFRDSNPPSNPELLNYLAEQLVQSNFSARHLIRTIMTSRVYQLSSRRNKFNADDETYFSHATTRMLTAEQLLDAICAATSQPEPFGGYPLGIRAIQVPDPGIDSYFLTLFGRSERVTACACERSGDVTLPQLLHLQNSDSLMARIQSSDGRLQQLLSTGFSDQQIVVELFQATLSRRPTDAELGAVQAQLNAAATDQRSGVFQDLFWALLNSNEFVFIH